MFESHDHAILELCREQHLVNATDLEAADDEHKATGKSLADLVVELGFVTKPVLLQKVADHLGLTYLEELPPISGEVINSVEGQLARTYGIIPLRLDGQSIEILASDPFNNQVIDDLTFALGKDVRLVVSDPTRIDALVKLHYGDDEATDRKSVV